MGKKFGLILCTIALSLTLVGTSIAPKSEVIIDAHGLVVVDDVAIAGLIALSIMGVGALTYYNSHPEANIRDLGTALLSAIPAVASAVTATTISIRGNLGIPTNKFADAGKGIIAWLGLNALVSGSHDITYQPDGSILTINNLLPYTVLAPYVTGTLTQQTNLTVTGSYNISASTYTYAAGTLTPVNSTCYVMGQSASFAVNDCTPNANGSWTTNSAVIIKAFSTAVSAVTAGAVGLKPINSYYNFNSTDFVIGVYSYCSGACGALVGGATMVYPKVTGQFVSAKGLAQTAVTGDTLVWDGDDIIPLQELDNLYPGTQTPLSNAFHTVGNMAGSLVVAIGGALGLTGAGTALPGDIDTIRSPQDVDWTDGLGIPIPDVVATPIDIPWDLPIIGELGDTFTGLATGLIGGIGDILGQMWDKTQAWLKSLLDGITNLTAYLGEFLLSLLAAIQARALELAGAIAVGALSVVNAIGGALSSVLAGIVAGALSIVNAIKDILAWLLGLIAALVAAFSLLLSNLFTPTVDIGLKFNAWFLGLLALIPCSSEILKFMNDLKSLNGSFPSSFLVLFGNTYEINFFDLFLKPFIVVAPEIKNMGAMIVYINFGFLMVRKSSNFISESDPD